MQCAEINNYYLPLDAEQSHWSPAEAQCLHLLDTSPFGLLGLSCQTPSTDAQSGHRMLLELHGLCGWWLLGQSTTLNQSPQRNSDEDLHIVKSVEVETVFTNLLSGLCEASIPTSCH